MNVTLPTLTRPPSQKRIYGKRSVDKQVIPEIAPTSGDHADEVRTALAAIREIDAEMVVLERKADRVWRNLHDPELCRLIGKNDPRRLEALDRIAELDGEIGKFSIRCRYLIGDVDSHGRYLTNAELGLIGMATDPDVIDRAHHQMPETKRLAVWQVIASNVVPF